MTIDELFSVKRLKTKLEHERAKLEDLKLCSGTAAVSKLTDLPEAQSQTSPTEKFAVKIVEAEKRIAKLEVELGEAQASLAVRLQSELSNAPQLWCTVLVRRFAAGFTQREVAQQLNYTKQYIQRLQRDAMTFVTGGEWRPRSTRRQSA